MNIKPTAEKKEGTKESCLVFKLMDQNFAVNCRDVMGIFRMEEPLTQMSGYSSHVRGVLDYRGKTLPVLELRSVLEMISFEQQNEEFSDMIDMRICDHKNWVEEFARCIEEDEPFKLATDPHMCAFGKWYYNFETMNQSLAFDLNKIEEPHAKLHEIAIHISNYQNIQDPEEKLAKKSEILQEIEVEYMAKIIGLLTELKTSFEAAHREMCVVISDDEGKMMGILVDEVLVVEELAAMNSQGLFDMAFSTSGIKSTARSHNVVGEIFLLDRDDLFRRLS